MDDASDSNLPKKRDDEKKATVCARKVAEMRGFWQQEVQALESGDVAAAKRFKASGDRIFVEVTDLVKDALARLAFAYLHEDSLKQDGVQELTLELYQLWHDLSRSNSAMSWEQPEKFWTCLKNRANNLFIRHVQGDYGKQLVKERDNPEAPSRRLEQREGDLASTGNDSEEAHPVTDSVDKDAEKPLHALLQTAALESMLAAIKNDAHRRALLLSVSDLTRPQIAEELGVKSVETVYNYIKRAKKEALLWAKEHYAANGEYDDWFGGSGGTDNPTIEIATKGKLLD